MVEDHPLELEGHEPYHRAEFEQNAVPGAPVEKVGQDLKLGVNVILLSPIGQPSREPGYFALRCNAESRPNYGVWVQISLQTRHTSCSDSFRSGIYAVPGVFLNSVGSIGIFLLYWIIAPLFAFGMCGCLEQSKINL